MSIQTMRDQSQGVIAKIIVGLIIVVFALFGFGSITTFIAPVPKVATVGGTDITQQEMEVAVERNRRIFLSQGRSPSEINEDELRAQVLESLVNRQLLTESADNLGLSFSDSKLDQEIVETQAFQIDGVFDPNQFQLVIGSAGYTPMLYRAEMKKDLTLSQLNSAIAGSSFMTPAEALRMNNLSQQVRDIAYLRIDVESLKGQVVVGDADVQSYYEKNTAEFMTEETVNLSYVEIVRSELADEMEVTDQELLSYYEAEKETLTQAERRRAAHILIEINDSTNEAAANERITALYNRIKQGEDFAVLAKEFSEDTGSGEEGGDLGFQDPGTFVEEFETALNDLEVNQMTDPVLTEFGYHLIKLIGVEPASVPEFVDVRDKLAQDLRDYKAEERFVELSTKLSEIAYESDDLEGPAAELRLEIKQTGHIGQSETEGLGANAQVINLAFSPDLLIDGNNSDIIELDPGRHLVIRVQEHKAAELQALQDVREMITAQLALEEATKLAEQQAGEIVAMLEAGSLTAYVADQYALEWTVVADARRSQPSLDQEIAVEAFKLPRPAAGAKSVGFTRLSDGDAAVITVTKVSNPENNMNADDINNMRRILSSRFGSFDFLEFREQLSRDTKVEIGS